MGGKLIVQRRWHNIHTQYSIRPNASTNRSSTFQNRRCATWHQGFIWRTTRCGRATYRSCDRSASKGCHGLSLSLAAVASSLPPAHSTRGRDEEKRERRGVLGTNSRSTRELPDEILRAFRDWCASPEMQVVHASFLALLTPN